MAFSRPLLRLGTQRCVLCLPRGIQCDQAEPKRSLHGFQRVLVASVAAWEAPLRRARSRRGSGGERSFLQFVAVAHADTSSEQQIVLPLVPVHEV